MGSGGEFLPVKVSLQGLFVDDNFWAKSAEKSPEASRHDEDYRGKSFVCVHFLLLLVTIWKEVSQWTTEGRSQRREM